MGRKTNSVSLRLNKTNRNYNNCWYSDILYADNFANTLKLGNYFSQTLKTIDMPCPQTSHIGAFKKASFLVCYLDKKKRVGVLEKCGVRSNTPLFSLNKKIRQDPQILNPVVAQETCLKASLVPLSRAPSEARDNQKCKDKANLKGSLNPSFAGPSFAPGLAVDTSFWSSRPYTQITWDIKTNAKNRQRIIDQTKAEQKHTASIQTFRSGLDAKNDKVVPSKGVVDPETGLITCSGLTLPSCGSWTFAPAGTPGYQKTSRQSCFEPTRDFANQGNGSLGGIKTPEKHNPRPCGHDGSNYTEQDLRRYYFYRGPLGLEISLQLLDLQLTDRPFQGMPLSIPDQASKAIEQARSSKNHVIFCSNTFPPFLKQKSLGQQKYPTCSRTTTLQTIHDTENSLAQQACQKNSLFSIGPGIFPYILEIFPERFSRFKYFFEEFFSGIGYDSPFQPKDTFQAYSFPRFFQGKGLPLVPGGAVAPIGQGQGQQHPKWLRDARGMNKVSSETASPWPNLKIRAELGPYRGVLAQQEELQPNKPRSNTVFNQTSSALSRAGRPQKIIQRLVTEKISLVCAFYKNMFIYGGKSCGTSCVFGPRLCTFSNRLMYNNYYRDRYYNNTLVYKEPVYVLKNSQSGSLNSLYGFYESFSRFWENLVFLSFYKSTNETCCALFLADTVAYLLERKVLFRSVKRQLLILLNNSKKSFAVSKNLLSKLFAVNKNKIVTGIRISCSGRVGGRSKKAQRSRKDTFMWGETGLHVFSSKLDFAKTHAETPFGTVGVQVWVCTK